MTNKANTSAVSCHAEEQKQEGVFYRKAYFQQLGSVTAAMLLSQIHFWYSPSKNGGSKLRVVKFGNLWIAKTIQQWADECGMKYIQAKEALNLLVSRGVIEKERYRFNNVVTLHIRLLMVEGREPLEGNIQIPQETSPDTNLVGPLKGVPNVGAHKSGGGIQASALVGCIDPPWLDTGIQPLTENSTQNTNKKILCQTLKGQTQEPTENSKEVIPGEIEDTEGEEDITLSGKEESSAEISSEDCPMPIPATSSKEILAKLKAEKEAPVVIPTGELKATQLGLFGGVWYSSILRCSFLQLSRRRSWGSSVA